MPPTIRISKSDDILLQYQITDFDETTSEVVKHDLQNATVNASILTASGITIASDIPCEIIDSSEGWVQYQCNQTATPGMFIVKFTVEQDGTVKKYPCYGDQWINVTGVVDEVTE